MDIEQLYPLVSEAIRRAETLKNLGAQDLLNTRDVANGLEKLASPELLADWLSAQGLIPIDVEPSPADLKRVVAFREGLRGVLLAGRRGNVQAAERLNRAARGARLEVNLGPDGAPRLGARVSDLDDALGRWLSSLVHAHLDGTWRRLKVCANPECRRAFYDDSRSYARRWCCKRCGDVIRARIYRRTERYKRLRG